jgi:general secretion pathway protein G
MKPIKAISKAQRGFSLIEIIIVVTIIGLIAAWVGNRVFNQGDAAKARIAKAQLSDIGAALDLYKLDVGKYPTQQDGLKALLTSTGAANWNGPYVRKAEQIKDPWSTDVIYKAPGADNRPFDLISYGADGKEGGDGVNKDITNY